MQQYISFHKFDYYILSKDKNWFSIVCILCIQILDAGEEKQPQKLSAYVYIHKVVYIAKNRNSLFLMRLQPKELFYIEFDI